jgi:hypothetical protein
MDGVMYMLPQNLTDVKKPYPSRTYRVTENDVSGWTDGLKAVEQAVWHILYTERRAYAIYSDDYGAETAQFIGKSFEFARANVGRAIREALLRDDRISAVDIDAIEREGLDKCAVSFTVVSSHGTFATGVVFGG